MKKILKKTASKNFIEKGGTFLETLIHGNAVLPPVLMLITYIIIFYDRTPCSLADRYQSVRGTMFRVEVESISLLETLTFNRRMGQSCPIKHTPFSSEREDIVLWWAFKFNISPATAETWHVKGHVLKVSDYTVSTCKANLNIHHLEEFKPIYHQTESDHFVLCQWRHTY